MWPSVYLNALLVSFALVQAAPWSQPVSYDAHQVIRFPITSPEDGKEIDALALKYSLSVWSSSGAYKDIMISPENAPPQTLMSRPHVTLIQDIQDLIDDETNHSIQKQSLFQKTYNAGPLTEASFFSDYQDYDTITEYMGSLPDAQKVILGQTYEKRDIFGFKFGTGAKSIVFNGGIHAREWISPAVVAYVGNFLASSDPVAVELRGNFTFTVIPVLNPDGYAYTRTKDRLWRKNRQPNAKSRCIGQDPNRNFGFKWDMGGASRNPCMENYEGDSPFQSQEAKALIDYIQGLGNVVSYLDFHSYSELWMYPWGYTCRNDLPDASSIAEGAKRAVNALKATHGISFQNGPICNVIYQASGSSVDDTYSLGVHYSYAVELRDQGQHGFILPAAQIVPSGEETLNALIALWQYVATQV